MTKFLLSCFLIVSMTLNAQIKLGGGSTDVGAAPVSTYYGYSYVQQIFSKQEINANAAGNITGLKFYLDSSMSLNNSSNWDVYLGYTTKVNFASYTDWIPVTQLTQVYTGTVTNANGVVQITFPTPFPYNNTDNLVLAAKENSPGYDNNDEVMYVYPAEPNSTLYYRSDVNNPDPSSSSLPAGDLASYKSVVTFDGLVGSLIPSCPLITYPMNNATFVPWLSPITWNPVIGATSYKVSIGTTPGGSDVVNQQSVLTNSFIPLTLLHPNTMYYVRVVSVGIAGQSSGCSETAFKTAPPLPVNDNCSGAVNLTVNPDLNCGTVTSGYTLGATSSGLVPDPCYGEPDDDVWYKFVATGTTHKISLLNVTSIGAVDDVDIYFQVFSGNCGTLSNILCSDADTSVVSGLTIGETYYMRVYSYNGVGSYQSFDVCVGSIPAAPVNDACSGALVASTFPYTYVQSDGGGATNNGGFIDACSDGMNDGTWFKFVGDGETFNITVTMPVNSDFDPQIGVYNGTCGSLSCVDTIDSEGPGGLETISIPTTLGNTYYVNIGSYSEYTDDLEGEFTISIDKNSSEASRIMVAKKSNVIYPNPFTEVLNIPDPTNVKSISVSDVAGRLVKSIANPGSVVYLGELKSGMYLVTLEMKDGSKQTIKAIRK